MGVLPELSEHSTTVALELEETASIEKSKIDKFVYFHLGERREGEGRSRNTSQ